MNKLTKLYKAIIESLDMTVNKDGIISMDVEGVDVPAAINGLPLILPTTAVLRRGIPEDTIAFHPISESILHGESPVLKRLRLLVLQRLTTVISSQSIQLMAIAADNTRHSKLNPIQSEFLSHVTNVDEKTLKTLTSIIEASSSSVASQRIINMYLKRGGKLKDESFNRLCKTSLPILTVDEDGKHIFGVKCRISKDVGSIPALFRYILPESENDHYSFGSNSLAAPNFHSLLLSYIGVAEQLNEVTERFKEHFEDYDELLIDISWAASVDNLSAMRDLIPPLKGNDTESPTPEPVKQTPVARRNHKVEPLVEVSDVPTSHVSAEPVYKPATVKNTAVSYNAPNTNTVPALHRPATATPERVSAGSGRSWNDVNPNPQPVHNPYNTQQPAMMVGSAGRNQASQYGGGYQSQNTYQPQGGYHQPQNGYQPQPQGGYHQPQQPTRLAYNTPHNRQGNGQV